MRTTAFRTILLAGAAMAAASPALAAAKKPATDATVQTSAVGELVVTARRREEAQKDVSDRRHRL